MKKIKVYSIFILTFAMLTLFPIGSASAHHNVQWEGMQVKEGQVGKVDVLKTTTIYKMKNKKLVSYKKTKAKDVHRVFKVDKKKKLYEIGSGQYLKINAKELKYKAVPQKILDQMKKKHIELTRGTYIGDSPARVKKVEKAKWVADMQDVILFDTKKYGYNAGLMYIFEKKKLQYVGYDLELSKEKHTYKEMKALHDSIAKRVKKDEKLKEKSYFETDGKRELFTAWPRSGKSTVVVGVTNEEGYTQAIVAFGTR
ncbi:hypothetical protein QR721_09535 [Aciduricibacillus chroicocephali]|uniref:Uncharacterized protein n=1 Tax=Aciduricibacillus chroicocephali TaxID=3054939 RepID=A0ABY9KT22_9BACI|nr:hypothetical protein QR721_09535 [Bacillaceae bacterium 44XB]